MASWWCWWYLAFYMATGHLYNVHGLSWGADKSRGHDGWEGDDGWWREASVRCRALLDGAAGAEEDCCTGDDVNLQISELATKTIILVQLRNRPARLREIGPLGEKMREFADSIAKWRFSTWRRCLAQPMATGVAHRRTQRNVSFPRARRWWHPWCSKLPCNYSHPSHTRREL